MKADEKQNSFIFQKNNTSDQFSQKKMYVEQRTTQDTCISEYSNCCSATFICDLGFTESQNH